MSQVRFPTEAQLTFNVSDGFDVVLFQAQRVVELEGELAADGQARVGGQAVLVQKPEPLVVLLAV